ncbi:MAG: hypothetical protein ACJ796_05030 [Gemmatimonadaceae bacterium]
MARLALPARLIVATSACVSTLACNRESLRADSAKRIETESRSAARPLNARSCQQVGEARTIAPAEILALKGEYSIIVVTAESPPKNFSGKLVIFTTDSAHRFFLTRQASHFGQSARRPELLLYGWTNLETDRFAPHAVAYPASSHDQDRPGVQVDSHGIMVLGNAAAPATMDVVDIGIYFTIVSIDSIEFSGRWAAGYALRPLPHGYFCAIRTHL